MGFFKKVFRPVRKIAKKIIPKEIRPFLPYIAAGFGPGIAGKAFGSGLGTALAQRGLIAAATSAATDEQGNPLRAGILAAAPGAISGGLGQVATKFAPVKDAGTALSFTEKLANMAGKGDAAVRNLGALKTIGAQTALDQSAKFAEIRQDEIDQYNKNLLEQGVASKVDRRNAIFGIYKNAGYDDDYVNTMLDTYGYADGGRIGYRNGGFDMGRAEALANARSINDVMPAMFKRKPKKKTEIVKVEDDEDEEGNKKSTTFNINIPKSERSSDLSSGLMAAMDGVQKAYGRSFGEMEPTEFKRFARGGEVEIEEQTDDLGIMDLMRDQGVEYGEQASYGYDDAMGETFEMFMDYKKKGTIPMEMEFDEFLELLQGRKEQGIKGTQVASGYKDDIEEMYEQYVFEMEEQGLQPMDFASFLRQARSGMANGGKVKRRKKGEPADEVIETEEEIFLDKMPRPKRKGIMEAAGGGSVGSRYSFLINKQKQGILSPDEEQELLMLEMTYADESQGKADGGIMNKNLLNTGMDKDMRGGGFIPEGTKEKADDVPARLSKNEFVMTADAVRAAGGGSVNKGAKKMYDLMYTLEAKV